jgi:hypothetical protein
MGRDTMYSKAPLTIEEMIAVRSIIKTLQYAALEKASKSLVQETEEVLYMLEHAIGEITP